MMFAVKLVVHLAAIQCVWGAAGPDRHYKVLANLTVYVPGKDHQMHPDGDLGPGLLIVIDPDCDGWAPIKIQAQDGFFDPGGFIQATDAKNNSMVEFEPVMTNHFERLRRDKTCLQYFWPGENENQGVPVPVSENLKWLIPRFIILPWCLFEAHMEFGVGADGYKWALFDQIHGNVTGNDTVPSLGIKEYLVAPVAALATAVVTLGPLWWIFRLIWPADVSSDEGGMTGSTGPEDDGILGTGFTLDDIYDNKEVVGIGAAALVGAGAFIAHKRGFCGNASVMMKMVPAGEVAAREAAAAARVVVVPYGIGS